MHGSHITAEMAAASYVVHSSNKLSGPRMNYGVDAVRNPTPCLIEVQGRSGEGMTQGDRIHSRA